MLFGFLGVIVFIGFVLLGRGPQGDWVGEFAKALEEEK